MVNVSAACIPWPGARLACMSFAHFRPLVALPLLCDILVELAHGSRTPPHHHLSLSLSLSLSLTHTHTHIADLVMRERWDADGLAVSARGLFSAENYGRRGPASHVCGGGWRRHGVWFHLWRSMLRARAHNDSAAGARVLLFVRVWYILVFSKGGEGRGGRPKQLVVTPH